MGTRNFFFESAIAIPQLEGSTSAIVIPQLLKKSFSAIAIFSEVRNLRASIPQFSAHFRPWNPVDSWGEKSEVKKMSGYCPFKASFRFPEKQRILKIFFVDF